MYTLLLIALVATAFEMTTCLLCGRQLWRFRKESYDKSRWLLGLGALCSGLLAAVALVGNILPQPAGIQAFLLNPWIVLVYLSMHIVMTLYPITVVRPDWLNPRRYFFLFLPVAVFAVAFLFFIGKWTPLYMPQDIWEQASKPDVFLRLAALFVMLPYCLILFLLHYNWRQSSASFWWILNYSCGLTGICAVHIVLTLTLVPVLMVVLPVMAAIFYLYSTDYEMEDRLRPAAVEDEPKALAGDVADDRASAGAAAAAEAATTVANAVASAAELAGVPKEDVPPEFGLWTRVCIVLDQEQAWRDPDLSVNSMARRCGTNVSYLNRIIREETRSGFKDLINTKRIGNVLMQLKENPSIDIQAAFFNAGYRSRATAWRNFKNIVGTTPTEYKQSLSAATAYKQAPVTPAE